MRNSDSACRRLSTLGIATLLGLSCSVARAEGWPPPAAKGQTNLKAQITKIAVGSAVPDWKQYSFRARQLLDGKLETSWQPQSKKGGQDESIEVTFNSEVSLTSIAIANGFQLTDSLGDLFLLNNRIDRAILRFSSGDPIEVHFNPDQRGATVVSFPERRASWVKIEIVAVVAGKKFHDLAVSELAFFGTAPDRFSTRQTILECTGGECVSLEREPDGPWEAAAPVAPPGGPLRRWVSAESGAKLRAAPDVKADALATIPFRDPVDVTAMSPDVIKIGGKSGRWCKVEWSPDAKTTTGWLFDAFVSETRPRGALQPDSIAGEWCGEGGGGTSLDLLEGGRCQENEQCGGTGTWSFDSTTSVATLELSDGCDPEHGTAPTRTKTRRLVVLSADESSLVVSENGRENTYSRCKR